MTWLYAKAVLLGVVLALLLGLLILTACSPPDECAGILAPPPQFDHMPNVLIRVAEVPADRMDATCRGMGAEVEMAACGRGGAIILPAIDGRAITRARWACYFRHEAAHVNGWGADHKT